MKMKPIFLLMIAMNLMVMAATAGLVEIGHRKGSYECVAVEGKYAYCAGPKFDIINIGYPPNPLVEGSLEDIGGEDIFLCDGFAYIAGSTLRIIDISIPSSPTPAGSLENTEAWAVYVDGGYASICGGARDCFIVAEVHDPFNPAPVGSLATWWTAMDVYGMSPYVYATRAFWGGGYFGTIDVSDPTNPALVGSLFIFPPPRVIDCCEEGYAYVAASSMGGPDEGLVVIDISNPFDPQEVARYHASYAFAVSVSEGYAYLSRCHELTVVDVHDPEHPFHVQTIYSPFPEGVYADDNGYTYLTDRYHGLSIFKLIESPPATVSLAPEMITVLRGDTLAYSVTFTNMTGEGKTFRFGALVRRSNGADHIVVEPTKVSLPPRGAKTERIKHYVPSKTPLGEYIYIIKIGASPMNIWDEDRFQFEVVDSR